MGGDPVALWESLSRMSRLGEAVEQRTDAEIAEALYETMGDIDMTSATFAILESIEGRLRRANGGPYRQCSWCSTEAVSRTGERQWACAEHEGKR